MTMTRNTATEPLSGGLGSGYIFHRTTIGQRAWRALGKALAMVVAVSLIAAVGVAAARVLLAAS